MYTSFMIGLLNFRQTEDSLRNCLQTANACKRIIPLFSLLCQGNQKIKLL